MRCIIQGHSTCVSAVDLGSAHGGDTPLLLLTLRTAHGTFYPPEAAVQ